MRARRPPCECIFKRAWTEIPAEAATVLPRMLTDQPGQRHAVSVPPPLVAKSLIVEMQQAARDTLAQAFAEVAAMTEMPFFQPICDLEVPRMSCGRVVLIGDAAYVARPHVGAGVTKAAEDACALAVAVQTDVIAGIEAFCAVTPSYWCTHRAAGPRSRHAARSSRSRQRCRRVARQGLIGVSGRANLTAAP